MQSRTNEIEEKKKKLEELKKLREKRTTKVQSSKQEVDFLVNGIISEKLSKASFGKENVRACGVQTEANIKETYEKSIQTLNIETTATQSSPQRESNCDCVFMHDDMEEALLSPSYATEADRNALMFTEDFQELMENTSQQTLHSRNKNIFNSSYQKNNHEISTIASIQESNKPNASIFLATYKEDKGCIKLWHIDSQEAEISLNCASLVTAAQFSELDPRRIYSGCVNGQIVLHDIRVGSKPVIQSPLLTIGHTSRLINVFSTGSTLLSVDADGMCCEWSFDILAQPLRTVDMAKDLNGIKCLSAVFVDPQTILCGLENGHIVHGNLVARANKECGLDKNTKFISHYSGVNCLNIHPRRNNVFLSTSYDCGSSLWSINYNTKNSPKHQFESFHVQNDCRWRPQIDSQFLSGNCNGEIQLWNIGINLDEPILSEKISDSSLSKISWNSSGEILAAGDLKGGISVVRLPQPEKEISLDEILFE